MSKKNIKCAVKPGSGGAMALGPSITRKLPQIIVVKVIKQPSLLLRYVPVTLRRLAGWA